MLNKGKERNERKELTRYLRYGDIKRIADAAGVSRYTVSNYLKGETKDGTVAVYVQQFVEKRKKAVQEGVDKAIQS